MKDVGNARDNLIHRKRSPFPFQGKAKASAHAILSPRLKGEGLGVRFAPGECSLQGGEGAAGLSRLRARPKGFPIALWKPSAPSLDGEGLGVRFPYFSAFVAAISAGRAALQRAMKAAKPFTSASSGAMVLALAPAKTCLFR